MEIGEKLMKKFITYITFALLLCSVIVFAGTSQVIFASTDINSKNTVELKPKLDTGNGKYGYVDKKGIWVIKPQFMDAKDFSEGLAVVRYFIDSDVPFSGYIDSKGKPAFKNRFYGSYDFKNGYAAVLDKNEKVSIIDKKGKVVLKTDYYYYNIKPQVTGIYMELCDSPSGRGESQKIGYITNGLKLIKPMFDGSPSYYRLTHSGNLFPTASHAEYDSNNRLSKLTRYLINTKMQPIALPSDDIVSVKEDMILLRCDKYYAFANMNGDIFDEIYVSATRKKHKFTKAENFSEGRAVVQVEDVLRDVYGRKIPAYGYINKNGTTFKEPQYVMANSFSGGVAGVQPYPNYFYSMAIIKSDGKYLMPPEKRIPAVMSEKYEKYFTQELYSQGEYDYVISEVKKIVSQITNNNMSELEKVAALHKYVIDHASYESQTFYDPTPRGLLYTHEAIGILKDGEGVCDAYSRLLGLLLTEAGIENKEVVGKVGGAAEDNHAWNLVRINGNYYHLDATFNDQDKEMNYYLVSDKYLKSLKGVLRRAWNYSSYPAAPGGYYNDNPLEK